MSFSKKILEKYIDLLVLPFYLLPKRKRAIAFSFLSEKSASVISMKTNYGPIDFLCPGHIPVWRAQTLFEKKPETIKWIDSFEQDKLFWDIGANVGCYSLYAAKRGLSVIAFEPLASNYYILCKNIEINKLDKNISAYCIAFDNKTRAAFLNIPNSDFGSALSMFSDRKDQVNIGNKSLDIKFKQGTIGFCIDDFMDYFHPSFPNYIKIDVDGIEDKIVQGGQKTLSNEKVKSVLVEIGEEDDDSSNIIKMLERCGLFFAEKNHAKVFDNTEWSSYYNYIFRRK